MRRAALVATVCTATACHRVGDRTGDAGRLRHGMGYEFAAEVALWIGLAAIGAGFVALVLAEGRYLRTGERDGSVTAAAALVVVGIVTVVGMMMSSSALLGCEGNC